MRATATAVSFFFKQQCHSLPIVKISIPVTLTTRLTTGFGEGGEEVTASTAKSRWIDILCKKQGYASAD